MDFLMNFQDNLPCQEFTPVAKFQKNGQLNVTLDTAAKVKCVRIELNKGQSNWAMIRLIQIETNWLIMFLLII